MLNQGFVYYINPWLNVSLSRNFLIIWLFNLDFERHPMKTIPETCRVY